MLDYYYNKLTEKMHSYRPVCLGSTHTCVHRKVANL